MLKSIKSEIKITLFSTFFSFFIIWWLWINLLSSDNHEMRDFFTYTYGLVALFGGILGLIYAKNWDYFKSLMGRIILAFSLGLLFQGLGQITYTYYSVFLGIEIPYPSIGDIFYFGTIPLYIYGVVLVGKITKNRSLSSPINMIIAITIPSIMILVSYFVLLSNYGYTEMDLTVLLDFGYPIGQALFISFAILSFLFSIKSLGGVMKKSMLLLLISLFIQYEADFTYSMQVNNESWVAAGINDFSYLLAYTLMSLSLISFNSVITKLFRSKQTTTLNNSTQQPDVTVQ